MSAADYPTDLLQPVFRFLRGRPEVRAAWLFDRVAEVDPKNRYYVFGLLVTGNAEAAKNELSVVVRHARKNGPDFGVMELDPKNPGLANIMSKFPPFLCRAGLSGESISDGVGRQIEREFSRLFSLLACGIRRAERAARISTEMGVPQIPCRCGQSSPDAFPVFAR